LTLSSRLWAIVLGASRIIIVTRAANTTVLLNMF